MLDDFTKEVKTLKDAPVTISLTKQKIIAYIDKEEENIDKFMQNMFIQLMAFQSYDELKLVFLLKKDNLKIITNIFEQKGKLVFSIFCIAKDIAELPNECKTFISIENNSGKVNLS